jgi:hypothetical protein
MDRPQEHVHTSGMPQAWSQEIEHLEHVGLQNIHAMGIHQSCQFAPNPQQL